MVRRLTHCGAAEGEARGDPDEDDKLLSTAAVTTRGRRTRT
jgi:hypothetical protein